MADPTQLKVALRGVNAWNQWWSRNAPQVKYIDLSGADLSNRDWSGVDWNYYDEQAPVDHFEGCNFANCAFCDDRYYAILNGGIFTNANFTNCDLSGVPLHFTTWNNANLSGAIFDAENPSKIISNADFSRAINIPFSLIQLVADDSTIHLPPELDAQRHSVMTKKRLYKAATSLQGITQFLKGVR